MATDLRELTIASRKIGDAYAPFVIPEIGINHGGDIVRAIQMIDDVADAGGCREGIGGWMSRRGTSGNAAFGCREEAWPAGQKVH